MIEKPKLFLDYREFLAIFAISVTLLGIRLWVIYGEYKEFVSKPFYYTYVEVLQQYQKHKDRRNYTVLRVYSPSLDLNFFTKTYQDDNFLDKRVRLKLFPSKDISFLEYMSISYIPSKINAIYKKEPTLKDIVSNYISKQHTSKEIANFYQAIFLAKPLPKELRDSISRLGVSHLIALSGFHLAILSGILFFIFRPIYRLVQQRFFPYRFDLIDIGFVVLLFLGWYVWFVNSPASLLRSYMMMVIGWIVVVMGIELVSFEFLATIVMILVLSLPKMLFSMAFWFSVLGVFYIFLLIKRFNNSNKIVMSLVISFGIFILMLPIIHLVFPTVSSLQLLSPILSLVFSIFYPLSMILHIFGVGCFFDEYLLSLLNLSSHTTEIVYSWYFGAFYIALSIGAIFYRWLFYLLCLVAMIFMIYIYFMV